MNLWTKLAEFAFIETEHLVLRPFSFMDSEDFYKIASNPENLHFIFPAQANLQESQHVLANYFMKYPLGIWAICDKDSGQMIGSVKFEKMDEIRGEAELGYFLHQAYWGRGLMTECVKNIIYLSFNRAIGYCHSIYPFATIDTFSSEFNFSVHITSLCLLIEPYVLYD